MTGVESDSAARSTGVLRTGPRQLPWRGITGIEVRFEHERECAASLRKRDDDCNSIGMALMVVRAIATNVPEVNGLIRTALNIYAWNRKYK